MSQVCLITGASRGLGNFLAHSFWEAGYSLCTIVRNAEQARLLTATFRSRGRQELYALQCDLCDCERVSKLIDKVRSHFPRLEVLVNNAAVQGPIGPLWKSPLSSWRDVIEVDLLAPVALCQAAVPWMIENGGGSIINLSGGGATSVRANFSAYATAKAGLVRFSETLAEEVKCFDVRVNCIAPGAMKTQMMSEILDLGASLPGLQEFTAAAKVMTEGGSSMEKVSELALFLASDASKDITGKLISAVWDDWEHWPEHLDELSSSDVYTLRRIIGRDRGFTWGDK